MPNSGQRHAFIFAQRATVAFATVFLLVGLHTDTSWATSKTWTNQVDSTFSNNNGWNPLNPPAGGDSVFFTNNFGGSVNITNTADGHISALFGQLSLGNSQSLIVNTSSLSIESGGANAIATIGSNFTVKVLASSTASATFAISGTGSLNINASGQLILASTNSIFTDGGSLNMNGGAITFGNLGGATPQNGAGAAILSVAGAFTNTATSAITNYGGAFARLQFTSTTRAVTNSGTMAFLLSQGAAGNTGLELQIGSGATPNTFFNNGTFLAGLVGGSANRLVEFSNQFVNAGLFAMTNSSTAAGGSLSFVVTGVSGTALTNLSTGTMRFVADGTGSGVRNVATLNAGGLVNLGTITFDQTGGSAGNNNDIILSAAGTSFSNAVGGQLILEAGNVGNVRILADDPQNFGTNLIAGGTLTYLTRNAGSVNFTNKGVVVLNNGNIAVGPAAGTLIVNSNGLIRTTSGVGTVTSALANLGGASVEASNGELRLMGVVSGAGAYRAVAGIGPATLTFAGGGSISSLFNTNSTIRLENMLTNTSVFVNQGTIVLAGGTYQSAANFTNTVGEVITNVGNGTLNAAGVFNFGSVQAVAGTLTISNLLAQGGTVFVGSGGTLATTGLGVLTNFGTISLAGAAGNNAILNLGTAAITNLAGGTIIGGGIVQNASQVVNLLSGTIFATSRVVELQFTNANTFGNAGTIGASAGATLTFGIAGAGSAIITNFGIINLTGGTLRSGAISNQSGGVIVGVGNVIPTVVNSNGTIMAANPVGGLNVFSVGLADFNDGTLGASNGAILNLVLGGGAGSSFNNNGTIAMLDGSLMISNGAPGVITNNLFVTGSGTISAAIVNNASASILASNGVLNIGLFNNLNSGTLHNFDGGSSISLTNAVLVNAGTIALGGGGLIMAGVITNQDAIIGPGALGASLVNDTTGTLLATNGTLIVATNTGAFVINRGVATISSGGVLSIAPSWLNTNGTIQLTGGVVGGGTLTNKGIIAGFGTFSNTIYNAVGGTINVASGNALQIVPAWNNAGGTVNLMGGVLGGGAVTNLNLITGFGTISSPVVNNSGGVLTATGGILTLSNAPIQNGTFIVTNTGTLNVATAWSNNGLLGLQGGTVIGGALTNLNQLTGFGTLTPLLVNGAGATLTAAGGTLSLTVAPAQSGTIVITNGGTLNVATAWQNSGTVSLAGGTLIDGTLTNLNGARVLGYGTIAANLINSGTLLASSGAADLHLTGATVFNQTNGVFGANNGRLVVDTVFTNAGTVSFINSVGTFASAVVNKGDWGMDSSTNVFLSNYTVATNGYVSMTAGDVSLFRSNFVNISTLSNKYNTLNGKFVMDGQGTQRFFVAGINLGGAGSTIQSSNEQFFTTSNGTFSTNSFGFALNNPVFGYSNNFALGAMELSDLSTTVLMDAFGTVGTNDGLVAGLYLNTLTLDPGSLLIVSNNVELYFQSTNGVTGVGLGVLGAGDNILVLNGGSLHQIGVVPEPSVLTLLAVGAFIIHKYRRRKQRPFP